MTFPAPQADLRLEVRFDGTNWTGAAGDLPHQAIEISNHGRQNHMDDPQPGQLSVLLDDPDGDYNPSNPTGAHWPNVTLGVQTRLRLGGQQAGLQVRRWDDTTGDRVREMWAETPDDPAHDVASDADWRMDVRPESWRPEVLSTLAAKWLGNTDDRSWSLFLQPDGRIEVRWSPDGTLGSSPNAVSTDAVPDDGARRVLRWVLDVDDGSGGWTVTFHTGADVDGSWTQLGAPVSGAGVTSVFAGGAALGAAAAQSGIAVFTFAARYSGWVHRLQLRDGIDGTAVVDADFDAQPPGSEPFTDATGLVWTPHAGARITDPATRFVGRATKWEPSWPFGDVSGTNPPGESRVAVEAGGLLSKINNSDYPLLDSVRRFMTGGGGAANLAGYWPCDDPAGSRQVAAVVGSPMRLVPAPAPLSPLSTLPEFGGGSVAPWLPPVMSLSTDTGSLRATLSGAAAGGWTFEWMYQAGRSPTGNFPVDVAVIVNSAGLEYRAALGQDGIGFVVLDDEGAIIHSSALVDAGDLLDGQPHHMRFRAFEAAGTDVVLSVYADNDLKVSESVDIGVATTPAAAGVGVAWTGDADSTEPVSLGQIAAWNHPPPVQADSLDAYFGHAEEPAGVRLERLGAEEGVPVTVLGDPALTMLMGPQHPLPLLALFLECERTDAGLLFEAHDAAEMMYRPLRTLYNQTPLVLDAAAGHGEITNPFAPVLDYSDVVNDLTLRSPTGATARGTVTSGPKSTQEPPDGAGPKTRQVDVNPAADLALSDLLSWRLNVGTAPGMRYPAVSPALNVVAGLADRWHRLMIGDRVQIPGLPPQHSPDPVDLLILGWSETIRTHTVDLAANCTRAGPYTVGVWVDSGATPDPAEPSRWSGDGSAVLDAAADFGTDTAITVDTPTGALWSTTAAFPFDLDVGGVRVRVTAVGAPAGRVQTFTIQQAPINGVGVARSAGTPVRLWQPGRWAL